MLCDSDAVFASGETPQVSDYNSVPYVHHAAKCRSQPSEDS
jgi:hypothetical protein